ncbi:unnamed protein product [Arctogadus glacialis]
MIKVMGLGNSHTKLNQGTHHKHNHLFCYTNHHNRRIGSHPHCKRCSCHGHNWSIYHSKQHHGFHPNIFQRIYDQPHGDYQSSDRTISPCSDLQCCNAIYRAEYGFLFIRVVVIAFRPAGGRRMANTETLLELVFNNTAPSESIPPAEEVANVLRNATVNNSTDSLQFDATTIVVERVVTTTTTIAPTTAQPLTITAKPTATTAQPPATTAQPPATTAQPPATTAQPPATTAQPPAPTQTTTTAAVALANVRFGFRSVRDTFTADLLNPSSAAFQDRATTITSALEPLFRRAFGSFTSLQVATFSQGSIITTMDAKFSSAPPSDQIARVLTDAAGTITAFDIETNSITVNGIVTGGVSSRMNKSSAFIISTMALLSWLLVSS